MKELKDYILESMQELYHFTNASNLVAIMKDDTWVSSIDYTDDYQEYPYISTTRMKYAGTGYPTQLIDDTNVVRVVFDGSKLNSKYKIKPVDKMGGKRWAIKANWSDPERFELNKSEILKQGNVEAEDRVYVTSEEIKGIHKYIKAIHINLSNIENKYIKEIREYCQKYDIELKRYKNFSEFNLGR